MLKLSNDLMLDVLLVSVWCDCSVEDDQIMTLGSRYDRS